MAFGVEAVAGGNSVGGTGMPGPGGLNVAFTVTAANLLLVAISHGGSSVAAAGATVKWNTTETLTLVASSGVDAGFSSVAWYRLDNPTATTANVNAVQEGAEQVGIHVVSFTDADLTLGTPKTATGTGTNPSIVDIASAAGNIVVSALCTDNENQTTTEAGTLIFEVEGLASDTDHNSQYQTAAGATTTASWTNASTQGTDWAASGLAVAGTGGAPAALGIAPIMQNYRNMGIM